MAAAWPADDLASVAKRPPLTLFGLLDQQFLHVRQPVPEAEKAAPHGPDRLRQQRPGESALWTQSLRAVGTPALSPR